MDRNYLHNGTEFISSEISTRTFLIIPVLITLKARIKALKLYTLRISKCIRLFAFS